MIGIVTLEGDEALWPIATIYAIADTEYEANALGTEELERLKEKLADMAVAEVRETFDADDELAHAERRARDEQLAGVRLAVASRVNISWDDTPAINAGDPDPEAELAVYAKLKEWVELTEGSIGEMMA